MNLVCVNLIFFALVIGSVLGADPKPSTWDAKSSVKEWEQAVALTIADDGGDVDSWQSMHKLLKRSHQLRGDLKPSVPVPRLPAHHQPFPSWADDADSTLVPDVLRTSSTSKESDDQPVRSAGLVGDLLGDSIEPPEDTYASTVGFLRGTVPGRVIGVGSVLDALDAVNHVAKSYQTTGHNVHVPVDQTVHYGTANY